MQLANGVEPTPEPLEPKLEALPLVIAAVREALPKALGVSVPFRRHPRTATGKIRFQEVKLALLARLGQHQSRTGKTITRLHQRRLVAVLGNIDALQPRLP
ncbi:MAG: hypothetical protein HC866_05475 [Leptolyngbyaceae cyanobacterium RU_5_1]|nr:hypothetical protein [Leptolyngbyaceae cyanobacterium RU_5_1]